MTKSKPNPKTTVAKQPDLKKVPEIPYYAFSLKARTSDGTVKEVTRLVCIRVEDLSLSLDCINSILSCNKVDIADIEAHGSKKNIVENTLKSMYKEATGHAAPLFWMTTCKCSAKLRIVADDVAAVVTQCLDRRFTAVQKDIDSQEIYLNFLRSRRNRIVATTKSWKTFRNKNQKIKMKAVK